MSVITYRAYRASLTALALLALGGLASYGYGAAEDAHTAAGGAAAVPAADTDRLVAVPAVTRRPDH